MPHSLPVCARPARASNRWRSFGGFVSLLVLASSCLISPKDYPLGTTGLDDGGTGANGDGGDGESGTGVGGSVSGKAGTGTLEGGKGGRTSGGGGQGGSHTSGGTAGTGSGGGGKGGGVNSECGNLIDDLEDKDEQILTCDGRVGSWYTAGTGDYNPALGTKVLPLAISGGRGDSQWAVHFYSAPMATALVGIDLEHNGTFYGLFNAHAFTGVQFYAKSSLSSSVGVIVGSAPTTDKLFGGTCSGFCDGNRKIVAVTTEWSLIQVPFSELSGGSGPFEQDKLTNVQFAPSSSQFDLWVDDPGFY